MDNIVKKYVRGENGEWEIILEKNWKVVGEYIQNKENPWIENFIELPKSKRPKKPKPICIKPNIPYEFNYWQQKEDQWELLEWICGKCFWVLKFLILFPFRLPRYIRAIKGYIRRKYNELPLLSR